MMMFDIKRQTLEAGRLQTFTFSILVPSLFNLLYCKKLQGHHNQESIKSQAIIDIFRNTSNLETTHLK